MGKIVDTLECNVIYTTHTTRVISYVLATRLSPPASSGSRTLGVVERTHECLGDL